MHHRDHMERPCESQMIERHPFLPWDRTLTCVIIDGLDDWQAYSHTLERVCERMPLRNVGTVEYKRLGRLVRPAYAYWSRSTIFKDAIAKVELTPKLLIAVYNIKVAL